jgi:DNA-binding phage protein
VHKIGKTTYPPQPEASHGEWMDSIRNERELIQMKLMDGVTFKNAVKSIAAIKGMKMKDVAEGCHKDVDNLHQQLNRGNPTLSSIKEILNAMGEDLVLVTSDGNKFKIE